MSFNRFNIVLIQPPGARSTEAFHELARLLQVSLESLGCSSTIRTNDIRRDEINVILGYQLMPPNTAMREYPIIVYQLEQLTEGNIRLKKHWLETLSMAKYIWDYSQKNIDVLKSKGFTNVRYLPIGHHPAMATITPAPAIDVDVLFYGVLTPRRSQILDALTPRCRLGIVPGVYGARRDRAVARAKIVLNIHYADDSRLEQVRLSHLLNNRRFVICEESEENPYHGMLLTAPHDKLVETCLDWLKRDAERDEFANSAARKFEAMSMSDLIREVLADTEWARL